MSDRGTWFSPLLQERWTPMFISKLTVLMLRNSSCVILKTRVKKRCVRWLANIIALTATESESVICPGVTMDVLKAGERHREAAYVRGLERCSSHMLSDIPWWLMLLSGTWKCQGSFCNHTQFPVKLLHWLNPTNLFIWSLEIHVLLCSEGYWKGEKQDWVRLWRQMLNDMTDLLQQNCSQFKPALLAGCLFSL